MSKRLKRYRFQTLVHALTYIILIAGSVGMLFPLFWMLSASLKESWQVFTSPITWFPDPIRWENYSDLFTKLPFSFLNWVKNTCIVVVGTIVGTLVSSTLVAYGFAKFRAPGKNILFLILLSTMMLPGAVTMIPVYKMYSSFGWIDTYAPLIVPAFFGSSFNIFLLRQYFLTIPTELEDAAKIDGMSPFLILTAIILPLSLPILITITIMQFNAAWNDFMGPLLYLNKIEKYTLALGLNFFKGQYNVQWNYLMAASFISLLPSALLFFFGQKYFVESITITGIK